MESFKTFLAEEKKPYRVVIFSHDNPPDEPDITGKRLAEESKKLGLEHYHADIDGAYSTIIDGKRYVHKKGDKKGFQVSSEDTVVYVRGSITDKLSWADLITQLERDGIFCINSRYCFETCSDKYRTTLVLKDEGLRQPKSVLISHKEDVDDAVKRLDAKFPIILKTLEGAMGVGVIFIESEISLTAIVQLLYKLDDNVGLLLQEYIKTDYDARVIVINGEVHGAIKRPVVGKDFRSNYSQGSEPEKLELTELEKKECIRAAKCVDGVWVGTDFIPSDNREKDPPFFIEVNSSPGTEGYEKATKTNVVRDALNLYMNRENWLHPEPFKSIYGRKA